MMRSVDGLFVHTGSSVANRSEEPGPAICTGYASHHLPMLTRCAVDIPVNAGFDTRPIDAHWHCPQSTGAHLRMIFRCAMPLHPAAPG